MGKQTFDELRASLYKSHWECDLSRAPAAICLSPPKGREADRGEIRGLLFEGEERCPSGRLIQFPAPSVDVLPRFHSTMVHKIKLGATTKAFSCVRGDMPSLTHCPVSSAPTADREFLLIILLILCSTNTWRLNLVDITRDFAQSECTSMADRYVLIAPSFILLSSVDGWNVALIVGKTKNLAEADVPACQLITSPMTDPSKLGLLVVEPLYGPRADPLR